MDLLISTIENQIKSEQSSVEYYKNKIVEDTALYTRLGNEAQERKETLETELAQLKDKLIN